MPSGYVKRFVDLLGRIPNPNPVRPCRAEGLDPHELAIIGTGLWVHVTDQLALIAIAGD